MRENHLPKPDPERYQRCLEACASNLADRISALYRQDTYAAQVYHWVRMVPFPVLVCEANAPEWEQVETARINRSLLAFQRAALGKPSSAWLTYWLERTA